MAQTGQGGLNVTRILKFVCGQDLRQAKEGCVNEEKYTEFRGFVVSKEEKKESVDTTEQAHQVFAKCGYNVGVEGVSGASEIGYTYTDTTSKQVVKGTLKKEELSTSTHREKIYQFPHGQAQFIFQSALDFGDGLVVFLNEPLILLTDMAQVPVPVQIDMPAPEPLRPGQRVDTMTPLNVRNDAIIYLDRHPVTCGKGYVLVGFQVTHDNTDSVCIKYTQEYFGEWRLGQRVTKHTTRNKVFMGRSHYLDRHKVYASDGCVLTGFHFNNIGGNEGHQIRITWEERSLATQGMVVENFTSWNNSGEGVMIYMDRHGFVCPEGSVLKGFVLETRGGDMRFKYWAQFL